MARRKELDLRLDLLIIVVCLPEQIVLPGLFLCLECVEEDQVPKHLNKHIEPKQAFTPRWLINLWFFSQVLLGQGDK